MGRTLVLYHANCMDGFCAAFAAWMFFGTDDAEYREAQYGDPIPTDVRDRDIYVLDFSWKRPEMLCIIEEARAVTVLDHHKSAAAELAGDLSVVRGEPHLSLRSRKDGVDVSEIARQYGGGGHKNAAGFEEAERR